MSFTTKTLFARFILLPGCKMDLAASISAAIPSFFAEYLHSTDRHDLQSGGTMQPVHLRTATGAKTCANCIMYKSLDEYKNLVHQFGPASPLVTAYGYGPAYLQKDGICEMDGDPPVMKNEVCDSFLSF